MSRKRAGSSKWENLDKMYHIDELQFSLAAFLCQVLWFWCCPYNLSLHKYFHFPRTGDSFKCGQLGAPFLDGKSPELQPIIAHSIIRYPPPRGLDRYRMFTISTVYNPAVNWNNKGKVGEDRTWEWIVKCLKSRSPERSTISKAAEILNMSVWSVSVEEMNEKQLPVGYKHTRFDFNIAEYTMA